MNACCVSLSSNPPTHSPLLQGIFFDDQNDKQPDEHFAFSHDLLNTVTKAYLPLIEKHKNDAYTEEQKKWQQIRRGRYTEFNLVYDRG